MRASSVAKTLAATVAAAIFLSGLVLDNLKLSPPPAASHRVDVRADFGQDPKTCYPDNWADPDLAVKHYCAKQTWNSPCQPFTPQTIAAFSTGLQQCFSTALQLFDEVLIAPHLDPLGDTSLRPKWRNMLRFDPLKKDNEGFRCGWQDGWS